MSEKDPVSTSKATAEDAAQQIAPTPDGASAAERRAELIARKKARKKRAKKKVSEKPLAQNELTQKKAAKKSTSKKPAKKKSARKKVVKKQTVRKAASSKEPAAKKTVARPQAPSIAAKRSVGRRPEPVSAPIGAPAAEPYIRVLKAMDELRVAAQEYAYKEMEAQRRAILEFQKTTRTTLKDLEDAALRTLRKLSP